MLPVVINAIFCVIAWTFVFLICRAEKRAEAARKRTRRIAEEMLSPQHSAGRPVAGTTTGSSSPSTSSTSSSGRGLSRLRAGRPLRGWRDVVVIRRS